jgi:hypothetical protein
VRRQTRAWAAAAAGESPSISWKRRSRGLRALEERDSALEIVRAAACAGSREKSASSAPAWFHRAARWIRASAAAASAGN